MFFIFAMVKVVAILVRVWNVSIHRIYPTLRILQRMLKILIGRKKLNLKLKILVLMRNPIWNHGRREKWKLPANAKHLIVNLENGTTDVLVTKVH